MPVSVKNVTESDRIWKEYEKANKKALTPTDKYTNVVIALDKLIVVYTRDKRPEEVEAFEKKKKDIQLLIKKENTVDLDELEFEVKDIPAQVYASNAEEALKSMYALTDSPERKDGFTIRNQKLLLIYEYGFQKKGLLDQLKQWGTVVDKAIIYLNINSTDPNWTYVYVSYKDPIHTKVKDYFDIPVEEGTTDISGNPLEAIRPIVRIVNLEKKVKQIKQILSKINSRSGDEYKDERLEDWAVHGCTTFTQLIWKCKSLQEALDKYCNQPSDALGIRALWEDKPQKDETDENYNPSLILKWEWHEEIWDMLLDEKKVWNPRLLHWLVDRKGGKKKSKFCRAWRLKHGGVIVKTLSGARHIATLLHERLKAGLSCKYILVDLPRATEPHKMWDTIEALLDGVLTVTKYKGAEVVLPEPPQMIVLANWSPLDKPDVVNKMTQEVIKVGHFDEPTIIPEPLELYTGPDLSEELKESEWKAINITQRQVEARKKKIEFAMEIASNKYTSVEATSKISCDRWKIGDIVPFTNSDGQNDYRVAWRVNPHYIKDFDAQEPTKKRVFK